MIRERFPLTSEQMELLLAFELAGNLEKLADLMAKDPSVISRNLQKLAREIPVLSKVAGRWHLTPLGRQANILSREYMSKFGFLLGPSHTNDSKFSGANIIPQNSLLVAINTQRALHDPGRGRRSNTEAEKNILRLLEKWRRDRRPIVHVKHVSENMASFFYRGAPGVEFIPELKPQGKEIVIEKTKASAFTGTKLEKLAREIKAQSLVLVGFTGGECIDATARQASDLGFLTFVVGDATATFDVVGPNGKLHKAEKVHRNTLAHLHALFAQVLETSSVLN